MERRLAHVGVGAAYHEGAGGRFAKVATALTAAGAGLLAARGGRSRGAAVTAGALLCAGAAAERWSIFKAGFQSAARPQDTVDPQRARIASGEARGAARTSARTHAQVPDGVAVHAPGRRPVPAGSPAIDPGPEGLSS